MTPKLIKTKVSNLRKGFIVFAEGKVGIVMKIGKTILHEHPYVKIKWHFSEDYLGNDYKWETYLIKENDQEVYFIYEGRSHDTKKS